MTCYNPIHGYRGDGGKLTFRYNPKRDQQTMTVKCGGCIGCRLDYSRDWAVRCVHEASMHEHNSFITLTYSPENLPEDKSLDLSHFQEFIHTLRNRNPGQTFRYFHCGEYGENGGRAHYHAILFGKAFHDQKLHQINNGNRIYVSPELTSLWPHGHSTVGSVTFNSAAYVARYVTKKVTGDKAEDHYWTEPDENGEIFKLKPEYVTMSRRPGIGHSWYEQHGKDLWDVDAAIVKTGKKTRKYPVPRYYEKLLEREDPQLLEQIKYDRYLRAQANQENNTDERLQKRQQHKELTTKRLIRPLEENNANSENVLSS